MAIAGKKGVVEPEIGEASANTALLGVVTIFFGVLIAGWAPLLAHSLPSNLNFAAWIMAAGVAFVAVVLAKSVAAEKVRLKVNISGAESGGDRSWMAYFAVLFMISSLGTMNATFSWGEGRLVLNAAIDSAHTNLDAIDAKAQKVLVDPELEQKRARVEKLLSSLEGEIVNANGGGNCGVGKSAREFIRQLSVELPGFTEISGSGGEHTCVGAGNRFKDLANEYKKRAREIFQNSREYVAVNGAGKERVLELVRERVAIANEELKSARDGSHAAAQHALEDAVATYSEMLVALEGVLGARVDLPRSLETKEIREALQLDSIAQIIPILTERFDKVSTYLYIAAAISMDVIVIMCFMRVLNGRVLRGSAQKPSTAPVQRDLRYLWVSP